MRKTSQNDFIELHLHNSLLTFDHLTVIDYEKQMRRNSFPRKFNFLNRLNLVSILFIWIITSS